MTPEDQPAGGAGDADALPAEIKLRPVAESDEDFLLTICLETSERVFGILELPAEQKGPLVRMQMRARETGWRQDNPDGDFSIVLYKGRPAGQWYVGADDERFTLVYAAVLEEFQGRGIAAALTRHLFAAAGRLGKRVSANVEKTNPARDAWLHLGFEIVGEDELHYQLEHSP